MKSTESTFDAGYDPINHEEDGWDKEENIYEEEEDDECHCSDPGCPCDGVKTGRL